MNIVSICQKIFGFLSSRVLVDRSPYCISTACDALYFDACMNCLIPSLAEYEKQTKIVFWDLGLEDAQKSLLLNALPNLEIRKFDFDKYPEYYRDLASFAWMSVCVGELMQDSSLPDKLIWLDTRDVIIKPLYSTKQLINLYGFYSPYSSTSIKALTYPTVLKLFTTLEGRIRSCDISNKQMLNTAVMGFSRKSSFAQSIVWEWMQLSRIKDMIQPSGSDRSNHRQDQSLLSLIYYEKKSIVPLLARRCYHVRLHQCSVNSKVKDEEKNS